MRAELSYYHYLYFLYFWYMNVEVVSGGQDAIIEVKFNGAVSYKSSPDISSDISLLEIHTSMYLHQRQTARRNVGDIGGNLEAVTEPHLFISHKMSPSEQDFLSD